MDEIYFSSIEISGIQEDNRSFYPSAEEAKKLTEAKFQEELNNIQKLLDDYQMDTPIMKQILRSLKVQVHIRRFTLAEQIAS